MMFELSDTQLDACVIEYLKDTRRTELQMARRPCDTADSMEVVAAIDTLLKYLMTREEWDAWRFSAHD